MLAIITGSGLYEVPGLRAAQLEMVETPYGTVGVTVGTWQNRPVAFLARHGPGHTVPPHRINYRANLWALKQDLPVRHTDMTEPYDRELRQRLGAAADLAPAITLDAIIATLEGVRPTLSALNAEVTRRWNTPN